jgi:DNA-binding NarL/FixJ family response regulator/anti-sigma regulatory factor (Ser/Thr protein kinase)
MIARKALLVSNNPSVRAMLWQILREKEWTIQDAENNAEALKLVLAGKFDLILTGEQTSGQEDIKLLRQIRRVHPHTRVIILTDETTPADVVSAMREHAFGYFSTSYSLAALALIVQYAMEEPCWDDGIEVVSATSDWVVLNARCDMKTSERLGQFFYEMIGLPDPEKEVVATAFRELLMNAIEHGAQFDPEKYVEISYVRTRRAVACRIKDPGEGFSLDEIPHSAIMNPPDDPLRHLTYREAENLRPGGFGVLLVKNTIDELLYSEKGNEVVLVKYIDRVSQAAS